MYTQAHADTRGLDTGDRGTHGRAGVQAKARPLETGVHTRTGAWTSGNVYLPTPQHTPRPTLQHLGARRWATQARRAAHTHLGHTRISLHVDARIHTPGGSQTRTAAPRKMPPTPRRSPLTTPYPVPRPPGAPRSPSVPLHCPRGLSPRSRRRAHLLRGRPWAAPRSRPQEGPRVPAAHPEAGPAAQLGASSSVSSFWEG